MAVEPWESDSGNGRELPGVRKSATCAGGGNCEVGCQTCCYAEIAMRLSLADDSNAKQLRRLIVQQPAIAGIYELPEVRFARPFRNVQLRTYDKCVSIE